MQPTCAHAEVGRVCNAVYALFSSQQEGVVWETDIVADSEAKCCMFCLECRQLRLARLNIFALLEHDPTWDVHVEQMLLPMHSCNVPFLIKAQASVVNLVAPLD